MDTENQIDNIALELARSMFILSMNPRGKEVTQFLTNINDWVDREEEWINMSNTEREILVEDAKNCLASIKENLPLVYDVIITKIIYSNHKSINHLLHRSSI